MARRLIKNGCAALALLPLMLATACTTSKTEAPPLSGPSELGLSLDITASPNVLTKDGRSQSSINIITRNANGQPLGGVTLRVETTVGGTLVDFGRLSTKSVTTGNDGRAGVVYTAPEGPASGNTENEESIVTIVVTPVGANFMNSVGRSITIRLMPQGQILPPAGRPISRFTFAPSAPSEGQDVSFDASSSLDCPPGANTLEQCLTTGTRTGLTYQWDFGDGGTSASMVATHRFAKGGAFTVGLTVTNGRGNVDRSSQFVNVGTAAAPTAGFTLSPTNPEVGQTTFFNGSESKAATGRTLVGYDWTFGDGGVDSGVTVSHQFRAPGTWTVTLTVTDDLGKTGTTSKSVTLGADLVPTPDFVYSPAQASPNQTINFDARLSQGTPGRTLTTFEWNFGDGGTATGERPSHAFAAAGKYNVVLTVTDSAGGKASVAKQIEVCPLSGCSK